MPDLSLMTILVALIILTPVVYILLMMVPNRRSALRIVPKVDLKDRDFFAFILLDGEWIQLSIIDISVSGVGLHLDRWPESCSIRREVRMGFPQSEGDLFLMETKLIYLKSAEEEGFRIGLQFDKALHPEYLFPLLEGLEEARDEKLDLKKVAA